jgi:hypothetical protein
MAVDIHNLIAAISPDVFCDPPARAEVKAIAKEKGYLAAADKAQPVKSKYMDVGEPTRKRYAVYDREIIMDAFRLEGLKNPIEKHSLSYDAFGENLEPIYFWLIDNLEREYKDMKKIDKVIDNFVSSPGSGHFSELGQKATRMQEEAMKMLGAANQVVKSILNILYDLKEFKIRLELYNKAKSSDPKTRDYGVLSLKQIWMDTVDFKRGNTSIKLMAQQYQYVTLIDAFMAARSPEDLEKLDLNDRVKRILQQRVSEFFDWISKSEEELRRRFEIEKTYLRSQVNTVKLYARWAKPYLKTAQQLEQKANSTASLVTAFNTVLFELVLLGQGEYDPNDDVNTGDLPEMYRTIKTREYHTIILVELKFRSVPERAGQQGYGFRGKLDATFTSYALHDDEISLLKENIEKDDFGDVFKVIEGATDESLAQLKDEIDSFLEDKKEEEGKKESSDTNPFSSLFSIFKSSKSKEEKSEKKDFSKGIPADNQYERVMRSQAIIKARKESRKIYDLYKKTHGMAAF